jgi:hypothetical protein
LKKCPKFFFITQNSFNFPHFKWHQFAGFDKIRKFLGKIEVFLLFEGVFDLFLHKGNLQMKNFDSTIFTKSWTPFPASCRNLWIPLLIDCNRMKNFFFAQFRPVFQSGKLQICSRLSSGYELGHGLIKNAAWLHIHMRLHFLSLKEGYCNLVSESVNLLQHA